MQAAQIRAIKGSDTLLKFLLATRCGLSEKTIVENVGEQQTAPRIIFEVTKAGERRVADKTADSE